MLHWSAYWVCAVRADGLEVVEQGLLLGGELEAVGEAHEADFGTLGTVVGADEVEEGTAADAVVAIVAPLDAMVAEVARHLHLHLIVHLHLVAARLAGAGALLGEGGGCQRGEADGAGDDCDDGRGGQ